MGGRPRDGAAAAALSQRFPRTSAEAGEEEEEENEEARGRGGATPPAPPPPGPEEGGAARDGGRACGTDTTGPGPSGATPGRPPPRSGPDTFEPPADQQKPVGGRRLRVPPGLQDPELPGVRCWAGARPGGTEERSKEAHACGANGDTVARGPDTPTRDGLGMCFQTKTRSLIPPFVRIIVNFPGPRCLSSKGLSPPY